MSRFAITHIGSLATMDPELGFVSNAAVIVADGKIEWIGPSEKCDLDFDSVIDAQGALVTPGLVDAHTHLVFSEDRAEEFEWRCSGMGYQEIAEKGGGIKSSMRSTRDCPNRIAKTAEKFRLLIQEGTTSFEVKTGYGLSAQSEVEMLDEILQAKNLVNPGIGLRRTFLGAHAVPPEFAGSPKIYLDHLLQEALPILNGKADYVDAFVESGYFEKETVLPYLKRFQDMGIGVRLHVDQLTDGDGAQFCAEIGAVSADHLEYTNAKGIKVLAESGTYCGLLPGSVFGLGLSKYPDARAMLDQGCKVVLATDFNPGSSPVKSLPMVMAIACRYMKMTPMEALTACTNTAAQSLNLAEKGSLSVGMDSDFVLWDAADYRELAYWIPGPRAKQVWIAGIPMLSR